MLLERLMVEVGADTKSADRKLDNLEDRNRRWTTGVAKAGGLALAGVAAGAGALIGTGVKVAADMEQARIGFTTLLGSAEKADAFIGEMKAFAARTPFEFAGLQKSASSLMATGTSAKDVIPLMTALGDATAAVGTGEQGIAQATRALGQMQQKGKVTGEEMLQLTEAGIPAWGTLAAAMGTDVATAQAAVSKGQVKVNELMGALTGYAGPMGKLAGMMDKQATSLTGMWSTLKDTVSMGLGDMAAPIVQGLKGMLPDLTSTIGTTLGQLGPQLTTFATGLMGVLQPLLPLVGEVVGALGGALGAVFQALAPHLPAIAQSLGLVAGVLGGMIRDAAPLLGVIGELAATFSRFLPPVANLAGMLLRALVPAIMPVVKVFAGFLAQLVGTGEEVTPFTKIIGLLAGTIQKLAPVLGRIGGVAARVLEAFLGMGMSVLEALLPAIEAIVPAIVPLVELFADLLEAIPPKVLGAIVLAFVALSNPIVGVALAVAGLVKAGEFLMKNWRRIPAMFAGVWRTITGAVSSAVGLIRQHVGTIVRIFMAMATGGLSEVVRLIVTHWGAIVSGLGDAVGAIGRFFTGLPGRVIGWIGNLGKTLFSKGVALLTGLVKGYAKVWLTVAKFYGSLPGRIVRFIGNVGRTLWTKGTALLAGLLGGIKAGARAVWTWLGDLPGRAARFIGTVSRTLLNKGSSLIGGLLTGAKDRVVAVWTWLGNLPDAIRRHVSDAAKWLLQVGRDVIEGLIQGIKDKFTSAGPSLGGWIKDKTEGFFRMSLGARSPSRLTMAIGRDVGAGLALGIRQSAPMVAQAAARLSGAATPWPRARGLSPSVAAGIPAGAGGVTYNYRVEQNVQGSVVTERQLADNLRGLLADKSVANAGNVFGTA